MLAIDLDIGDVVLENGGDVDLFQLDTGLWIGKPVYDLVYNMSMAVLVIERSCGGQLALVGNHATQMASRQGTLK